ncbi:hypothetical protein JTE90_018037 [Oedothorax gibbosus]|uniref:EF-hand domain-containing protein n=1 Tax=Oedothorax gibbosus TaxID=931172 RepID=A0AAV6TUS3_9ARAC|nr:hypothetical protein JTE90_018037 [Oedothorax gibbosus]
MVDVDKLSIQEILFRYFRIHDTNSDNRLDGIEVIQAMLHYHDEGGSTSPPDYVFRDDELEMFVDPIFQQGDANKDGFLDYTEFMTLQVGGSAV